MQLLSAVVDAVVLSLFVSVLVESALVGFDCYEGEDGGFVCVQNVETKNCWPILETGMEVG